MEEGAAKLAAIEKQLTLQGTKLFGHNPCAQFAAPLQG
jgi:hypothetical protein